MFSPSLCCELSDCHVRYKLAMTVALFFFSSISSSGEEKKQHFLTTANRQESVSSPVCSSSAFESVVPRDSDSNPVSMQYSQFLTNVKNFQPLLVDLNASIQSVANSVSTMGHMTRDTENELFQPTFKSNRQARVEFDRNSFATGYQSNSSMVTGSQSDTNVPGGCRFNSNMSPAGYQSNSNTSAGYQQSNPNMPAGYQSNGITGYQSNSNGSAGYQSNSNERAQLDLLSYLNKVENAQTNHGHKNDASRGLEPAFVASNGTKQGGDSFFI